MAINDELHRQGLAQTYYPSSGEPKITEEWFYFLHLGVLRGMLLSCLSMKKSKFAGNILMMSVVIQATKR
jgi:hypothetical protein